MMTNCSSFSCSGHFQEVADSGLCVPEALKSSNGISVTNFSGCSEDCSESSSTLAVLQVPWLCSGPGSAPFVLDVHQTAVGLGPLG